MDRFAKLLQFVDLSRPGLEIGPLDHPILHKGESDVRYVDHTDTEGLRHKYADDPNVSDVVDVDHVWDDRPLVDVVGGDGPFQYAVASHVIEHVPNLVGWLRELTAVLEVGGVISLIVPDKRYCFDVKREVTPLADVVDAWLTNRRRPTVAATFDFYSRRVEADTPALWAGEPGHDEPDDRHDVGLAWARKRLESDEYIDVHCSTFTPDSFLAILRGLAELDALELRVAAFHPTAPGELDFFVTLQRQPSGLDAPERRRQQLEALTDADASARRAGGGDDADATADAVHMRLSRREVRAVQVKRRLMEAMRRRVGRRR